MPLCGVQPTILDYCVALGALGNVVEIDGPAAVAVSYRLAMIAELDDESGVARYRQIAAILKDGIREGEWKPSQRVPSTAELSQRYGVDVGTAARAHAYLIRCGYLVRRPGLGAFVLPPERWPASQG